MKNVKSRGLRDILKLTVTTSLIFMFTISAKAEESCTKEDSNIKVLICFENKLNKRISELESKLADLERKIPSTLEYAGSPTQTGIGADTACPDPNSFVIGSVGLSGNNIQLKCQTFRLK